MEDSKKMRYPAKETAASRLRDRRVLLAHAVQNGQLSEAILKSVREKIS